MRTCKNNLPDVASILEATQEEKYIIQMQFDGLTLYENPLGWVFDRRNATRYNLETVQRRLDEVGGYGLIDYIRA
jgi:hypothetical protein